MVPDQAERIVKNIKEGIDSLRVFPFRNRTIKDFGLPVLPHIEIRSIVEGGFRIFYCILGAENEIIILTILKNTEKLEKIR